MYDIMTLIVLCSFFSFFSLIFVDEEKEIFEFRCVCCCSQFVWEKT